jgi:hypothetical protein
MIPAKFENPIPSSGILEMLSAKYRDRGMAGMGVLDVIDDEDEEDLGGGVVSTAGISVGITWVGGRSVGMVLPACVSPQFPPNNARMTRAVKSIKKTVYFLCMKSSRNHHSS